MFVFLFIFTFSFIMRRYKSNYTFSRRNLIFLLIRRTNFSSSLDVAHRSVKSFILFDLVCKRKYFYLVFFTIFLARRIRKNFILNLLGEIVKLHKFLFLFSYLAFKFFVFLLQFLCILLYLPHQKFIQIPETQIFV